MPKNTELPEEVQKFIEEYRGRDDAWLLEQCRGAKGKRLLAIYMLLVERGYTAQDIGN